MSPDNYAKQKVLLDAAREIERLACMICPPEFRGRPSVINDEYLRLITICDTIDTMASDVFPTEDEFENELAKDIFKGILAGGNI